MPATLSKPFGLFCFAAIIGLSALVGRSHAHSVSDTLKTCTKGDPSALAMIEAVERAGWTRILPESGGLSMAAVHLTSMTFWDNLELNADASTWAHAFHVHRLRLERAMGRAVASSNTIPFVSDAGGNNFMLLEHRAIGDYPPDWTCVLALEEQLELSRQAEALWMREAGFWFGQYGEVFRLAEVSRSEVFGVTVNRVEIARLDPVLLANDIEDHPFSTRSSYRVYGTSWSPSFFPIDQR